MSIIPVLQQRQMQEGKRQPQFMEQDRLKIIGSLQVSSRIEKEELANADIFKKGGIRPTLSNPNSAAGKWINSSQSPTLQTQDVVASAPRDMYRGSVRRAIPGTNVTLMAAASVIEKNKLNSS